MNKRRLLALPFLVLALPCVSQAALTSSEMACRHTIAQSVTRYAAVVDKVLLRCKQWVNQGLRDEGDNCNDVDEADLDGELDLARADVASLIDDACAGEHSLLAANYHECPAPAAAVDDGGISTGIDDFDELSECLLTLTDGELKFLFEDTTGVPPGALSGSDRSCQLKLGRGTDRIFISYLVERRRCQKVLDRLVGDGTYGCDGEDPRGHIATAITMFGLRVVATCGAADLTAIDACATSNTDDLVTCAEDSIDARASDLIGYMYEMP